MAAADLCLSWDDHHNALVKVFDDLLQSNTLVDCTIAAEGQYLKAHKVILSACSPYFQMLFSQENEKNPIVVLKDMKFQELRAIIDFVYRGKVKVQDSELDEFLMAAESLQIKGLACHQKKKPPEKSVCKIVPKKLVSPSSFARKRRRASPTPSVEEIAVVSPSLNDRIDNNLAGDVILSSDIPVEVQVSSSAASSSLSSANSDQWRSHQSSPRSPHREMPSDARTTIKTEPEPEPEPEPLPEMFVSETKIEEYVDDMELLDTGEGNEEDSSANPHPQQSSSQYSGYPSIFDSTEDSFLMSQMTEQSNGQDFAASAVEMEHLKIMIKGIATQGPPSNGFQQMQNMGNHLPFEGNSYRRCFCCRRKMGIQKRTKTLCIACKKPLCKYCFIPYHTQYFHIGML